MSRLLENDSLALLAARGVPVPNFEVCASAEETADALARLGGRVVIKGLVPVGKRGRSGAVQFAASAEEARARAEAILDMEVRRFPVKRLIVMEALDIRREMFCSVSFDAGRKCPLILFSAEGGVDVETLACAHPEKLLECPVNILEGLNAADALRLARRAGLSGGLAGQVARAVGATYEVFCAHECEMIEVNPLAELADGRVVVAAAAAQLDAQALFRHPDLAARLGAEGGNGWRPFTELEMRMREVDAIDPEVGAIRFNELDGDVGFMVTGGGYGLSSMEALLRRGGRPATTFDITPGRYDEKMREAVKAVLSMPGLKGLLLAGNVSNFTRVDVKAAGVARALKEMDLDYEKFPVIVRYAGPGVEEARRCIAEVPGVEWHEEEASIEYLAERVMARVYGDAPPVPAFHEGKVPSDAANPEK